MLPAAAELASDDEPVVAADAEPEAAWPTHEVDEPSWTVTCEHGQDGAGQPRLRGEVKGKSAAGGLAWAA